MTTEYKPRLIVELTPEQMFKKQRLLNLSYGMQRAVFSIIIDDLLDLVEEHGAVVLGLILNRTLRPRDVITSLQEAEKGVKDEHQ